MNIDITPYIKELLYEHNNLVIPGFGALTLQYASSTIDHVQGMLNPPTKSISFDSNVVVNDGKLVDIIQKKHQVSTEEANIQISKFVNIVRDQLERREMVNIAGVGRLYKDFENKLQFIPDSTNFNKDAFGLPNVQFFPILKEAISVEDIAPSGTLHKRKQKKEVSFIEKIKQLTEEHSWLPIALATLLLLIVFTFLFKDVLFKEKLPISDVKVNERPVKETPEEETTFAVEKPIEEDEDTADFEAEQDAADEDVIDTESITTNPNQRIALVSVGVFGNKANAQRRIEQVYDYGYDVLPEKYVKKGRELTKVGIQFAFETEEEFQRTVKEIKRRFKDAKVIKKE